MCRSVSSQEQRGINLAWKLKESYYHKSSWVQETSGVITGMGQSSITNLSCHSMIKLRKLPISVSLQILLPVF